jgi:hypothetical protein
MNLKEDLYDKHEGSFDFYNLVEVSSETLED